MTAAPQPLFGQTLGLAQQALGVLARRAIADAGTDFDTWLTLNALAQNQDPQDASAVINIVAAALPKPVAEVEALIATLESRRLVYRSGDTGISLTPGGAMRHAELRSALQAVSRTALSVVEPTDLDTTRRVLEAVTLRAKELAAAG